MKSGKQLLFTTLSLILVGLCVFNVSYAYHIWVTESKQGTTAWDASKFTFNNTGTVLRGGRAATDGVVRSSPNNDAVGLLWVADAQVSVGGVVRNCTTTGTAGAYQSSGQEPYNSFFSALATWSAISSSTINMQYVCGETDMGSGSVDATVTGGVTYEVTNLKTPILNGTNEFFPDDTSNLTFISTVLGGAVDPSSLLGVGIAVDPDGKMLPENTGAASTRNPITEAFILTNESPNALRPNYNRTAVYVHELGHTLGIGHTNAILNARGALCTQLGTSCTQNFKLNNQTTTPTTAKVPTMYAFALSSSGEEGSLEIDDIAAATRNYPRSGASANFGAISGQVLNQNGVPPAGASIIAYDAGGNEIGTLVGGNPQLSGNDIGRYRIDFVPPGDYTVTIVPLLGDSSLASAKISAFVNIDATFPSTPFNFNQAFYNGSNTEGFATKVTVLPATETSNINFYYLPTTFGGTTPATSNLGRVQNGLANQDNGGCQANQGAGSMTQLLMMLLVPFGFIMWRRKRA